MEPTSPHGTALDDRNGGPVPDCYRPPSSVAPVTHAPTTVDRNSLDARLNRLRARLRAKRLSVQPWENANGQEARTWGEAWRSRMSAFTTSQIEGVTSRLGPVIQAPWPKLDGCLGVLFTSRTGSSYLARELAKRFKIGQMEESLNPHLVEGIASADIIRSYANGWFSFKLGVPGIISAEHLGAIEQYIDSIYFIMLIRKDIVGQAVSLVKANQTGQWHSITAPRRPPEYDAAQLATSIRVISKAVGSLRTYLDRAERPWRTVYYEDFEHGDFSTAEAICDEFRIPRIAEGEGPRLANLSRTADEVNDAWRARFREDIDEATSELVEAYRDQIHEM
jgi:hypothetical protein